MHAELAMLGQGDYAGCAAPRRRLTSGNLLQLGDGRMTTTDTGIPNPPTEEHPERGYIGVMDVPAFKVEHWLADGEYVFRSSEFDLIAADRDIQRAVDRFVESAEDLWSFVEEQDDPSENELELASLLGSRFRRILHQLERQEQERRRRLISISFPRTRRRGNLRSWHPGSIAPDDSSQHSLA
jgi:hypothetical protein